ncbi:HAD family hydrolase [Streptomyces finlayi]|uniref:HAD family hydrolase n=1 Tax=Streptomyces finlayi TaxID=67296 RepID=UPI0016735A58|nr:HAD-IA family hydrolase [Streptomyces finlayi]
MKAVLFDFSGTLLRIESTRSWVDAVLSGAAAPYSEEDLRRYADLLERAGALPGGRDPESVPPALAALWETRDESAELHRAAYTGLSRQVELPDDALHDALYARHMLPGAWQPYPDTAEVLGALRARGIPVAVVSNIGWDLRPVFRAHGLDRFVDAYVLSYEYGVQKPDPRLFRVACEALGQEPADTLMVGDSRHADGGAAALGCTVHFVDHLPVAGRPDGLRPVLDLLER